MIKNNHKMIKLQEKWNFNLKKWLEKIQICKKIKLIKMIQILNTINQDNRKVEMKILNTINQDNRKVEMKMRKLKLKIWQYI